MLRIATTTVLFLSFLSATVTGETLYAETVQPNQTAQPAGAGKQLDVSNFEAKYWAPKDVDFSVVQNRTYPKENRLFLSLNYGPIINDGYSEGNNTGITANYFFTERWGLQVQRVKASLKDNKFTQNLTSFGGGVQPDFGRLSDVTSVGISWVPIYAKMSLLSSKIIYFDMAITPTIGQVGYSQMTINGPQAQSAFSYGVDVTQYFFLSRNWAIRADVKNFFYKEEIAKYNAGSSGVATGANFRSTTNHTTIFMIGAAWSW